MDAALSPAVAEKLGTLFLKRSEMGRSPEKIPPADLIFLYFEPRAVRDFVPIPNGANLRGPAVTLQSTKLWFFLRLAASPARNAAARAAGSLADFSPRVDRLPSGISPSHARQLKLRRKIPSCDKLQRRALTKSIGVGNVAAPGVPEPASKSLPGSRWICALASARTGLEAAQTTIKASGERNLRRALGPSVEDTA